MIEQLFGMFDLEIGSLSKPCNVVLAGSVSLIAHGLNIGWQPGDLDLVIHEPTPEQLSFLDQLFTTNEDDEYADHDRDESEIWYTLTKGGLKLNVKVLYNVPLIMVLRFNGLWLSPINNVLDAKKKYRRPKDQEQFDMIIQDNFTMPVTEVELNENAYGSTANDIPW